MSSDGADSKLGGDAEKASGGTYGVPRDVTNLSSHSADGKSVGCR